MEINYSVIGIVVLIIVVLVILFIRKNKSDREKLEQKLNQSDITTDKHKEDEIED